MSKLREAFAEALPCHEDKIRDSIDPLFVRAAGAAFKAKHFALERGVTNDSHLEFDDDGLDISVGTYPEHGDLRKRRRR